MKSSQFPFLPSVFMLSVFFLFSGSVLGQEAFSALPKNLRQHLEAVKITGHVTIDGRITEAEWNRAQVAAHFITALPRQGLKATYDTEVKVLYDEKYLYISARAVFTPGPSGLQVQDLRRDFDYANNELFEVLIDPFEDPRIPVMAFAVTPYGNQMEAMLFSDYTSDYNWDAVWQAASKIEEHAWTTEMAIPFSSLRYPNNTTEWSINFVRKIRNIGEQNGWSPWPQAYSENRLDYGGILTGIHPPEKQVNMQITPYVLENSGSRQSNKFQSGGEIKLALNSNTLLEGTFNTDFAQADVDRQVINLSRSSVFLPEKRQFFLENASLFSVGQNGLIQPFFSRRIGIGMDGSPLKIDGGLRFVHQDLKQSTGVLLIRQDGSSAEPGATFGVARYKRNIGQKLQLGVLGVLRKNDATDDQISSDNPVGALDFFWQPNSSIFFRGMGSIAGNSATKQSGTASFAEVNYSASTFYNDWTQTIASKDYNPQTGFLARSNFINTKPLVNVHFHRDWFPSNISFFNIGLNADIFHEASSGNLQEATYDFMPAQLIFSNQAQLKMNVLFSKENITDIFTPVSSIDILPGNYRFVRFELLVRTNTAAPFSTEARFSSGRYYSGYLQSYYLSLRAAPIPRLSLTLNYTLNSFKDIGSTKVSARTYLLAPELRMALNTKVLLSAFYQYNSDLRNGSLNGRFSWEYRPLSFIYVVLNNRVDYSQGPFSPQRHTNNNIIKLSYVLSI
jgi:hypothetical protein